MLLSIQKSHTCEESGEDFKIPFWHLLINFEKPEKSEYLKNEKNRWRHRHFTIVYQKPQSYENTVPKIQSETEFIVILGLFCPFTPATAQKLKMKTLGDIISQKYTKDHDHRLHCS